MKTRKLAALLMILCLLLQMAIPVFGEATCPNCGGTEVLETVVEQQTHFGDVTEDTHSHIGSRYNATVCAACETVIEQELIEDAVTLLTEEHNFVDGVCECGYQQETGCQHPEEYVGIYEYFLPNYYFDINETTHTGYGNWAGQRICHLCDTELSYTTYDEKETLTEEHTFVDGVCECGYDGTTVCTHPEEYRDEFEYLRTESSEAIDETTHVEYGDLVVRVDCDLCGERISETIVKEDVSEISDHYYDDGICYVCGYENACEHPEEYIYVSEWIDTESIEAVDEFTHAEYGQIIREEYCELCGEWLSYVETGEIGSEVYDHHFENGYCSACGYENTCEHPGQWEMEYIDGYNYEIVDDETHAQYGDRIVEVYCVVCDELLESTVVEENASEVSEHDFSEGKCWACGYENSCEHPEDSIEVGGGYIITHYVEYIDEKTHLLTYTEGDHYVCRVCNEILYSEVVVENETKIENHGYVDGVCSDCYYLNTCEHPEESIEYDYYVLDGEVIEITETTCTRRGETHAFVICSACNEVMNPDMFISDDGTATEEHYFIDGVCSFCGYAEGTDLPGDDVTPEPTAEPQPTLEPEPTVAPCEHPDEMVNWYLNYVNSNTDYLDNEYHTTTCDIYKYTFCMECGAEISNVLIVEDNESKAKHLAYDDGICVYCNGTVVCEHPEDMVSITTYYADADSYSEITDDGHTVVYNALYIKKTCGACDSVFCEEADPEYTPTEITEAHFYGNSADECPCGYLNTCTHPEDQYVVGDDKLLQFGYMVSDITEETHAYTGMVGYMPHCGICGGLMDDGCYDVIDLVEPHEYEDGICIICGYEEPAPDACAHPEDRVVTLINWSEDTTWVASDSENHIITGDKTVEVLCKDCMTVFSSETTAAVAETEAHEFEDGACYWCGYVSGCEHPSESLRECYEASDSVYTYVDADFHINEYDLYVYYVCDACSDYSTEPEFLKHVDDPIPHFYVDGVCACGAVEAEPTVEPTVEPTAEPQPTLEPEPTVAPTAAPTAEPTVEPTAKPVATAAPVVTPEPVIEATAEPTAPIEYTEVKADEVVNGVSVAEAPEMVNTLLTVIETAEATAESVVVEVVNSDKVLTVEEQKSVDALPVNEQVLVVLTALGYGDAVNAVISADEELVISENAAAMMESIQLRLDTATDEEKATLNAVIAELFPVVLVEIDGELKEVFKIELEVTIDDEVTVQRFGFVQDEEGVWRLFSLEIGQYIDIENDEE